jgi:hypothetical protein
MNVGKKNTESFYFLGCLLEVIIRLWGFGFLKKNWRIFPMKKSFVWGQNHIFQVKFWQKISCERNQCFSFLVIFVSWQIQKGPGKWHRAIWAI